MIGDSNIKNEFGHLYNQYRQRFVIIARRYVRDRMIAEDIVADSFVSFWNNRNNIPSDTNLPAYILTIVKNKSLNWLHAQQIHMRIENNIQTAQSRLVDANIRSLESCDPERLFASEVREIVKEATSRMPELTRIVFEKSRNEGKTYAEIAKECGISTRQVTSEIQKALAILRRALKDYMPAIMLSFYLNNLL
ncbi:MAG: RNA polymerase sigma-70 factor [Bacteroidales bacterium]|nr:RNA polymerase sigma-70 factor [Bacteroidales bacterium]